MKHRILCFLSSTLGPTVLWLLCRFVKVDTLGWEHIEKLREENKPLVLALWHGQIIYFCYYPPLRGAVGMVSQHNDGEYIVRVMKAFKHTASRGSTRTNGSQALRQLARMIRKGREGFLTIDGPRGPAEEVKGGVIQLASISNAVIVPMCFSCKRMWRVGSWDRTMIPKGFGRGVVILHKPIEIPSRLDREQLEDKRAEVEQALREINAQAEESLQ
jgi:lysophospholipid acyltransferase (LPLAT)-like uncharacterized protein